MYASFSDLLCILLQIYSTLIWVRRIKLTIQLLLKYGGISGSRASTEAGLMIPTPLRTYHPEYIFKKCSLNVLLGLDWIDDMMTTYVANQPLPPYYNSYGRNGLFMGELDSALHVSSATRTLLFFKKIILLTTPTLYL